MVGSTDDFIIGPQPSMPPLETAGPSEKITIEIGTPTKSGISVKNSGQKQTSEMAEVLVEKAPPLPTEEGIEQLEESAEQVEQMIWLGNFLTSHLPPTFSKWIYRNREKIAHELLHGTVEHDENATLDDLPPRLIKDLALSGLLRGKEGELDEEDLYLRLIMLLPDSKDKKLLYFQQILYQILNDYSNELKDEYETTKDPALKDKFFSLTQWLNKHKVHSKGLAGIAEKAVEQTGSVLKVPLIVLSRTIGILRYIDAVGGVATLGAGNVLKLGINLFDLVKILRHKHLQKKWKTKFHEKEPAIDKTTLEGQAEGSAYIEHLLKKRESEEERKRTFCQPECEHLIQDILLTCQSPEEAKARLREKGIRIEEMQELNSMEELKSFLEQPENEKKVLDSYVRHQEAVQMSVKNALKTCEANKAVQIQKALNRKLIFNTVKIALTVILGAAIIVINILVLTSVITVPQFVLPILAVSTLIAAVTVGAVGLFYFYRNNPQRFKEMIFGLNARILFYQIPEAYRNFFLKRKKQKQIDQLASTYVLRAKIREIEGFLEQNPISRERLPEQLQDAANSFERFHVPSPMKFQRYREQLQKLEEQYKEKVEKLEKEREKREEKIFRLEKKAEYWKTKVAPLKERLRAAGVADYLKASRLEKDLEGKPIELSKLIVDGIFVNPNLLDTETLRIVDRLYGIDIEKKRVEGDPKLREKLIENLDTYFAKTPSQFIKFIRKRMKDISDEENRPLSKLAIS